jgi:hypothetical protein
MTRAMPRVSPATVLRPPTRNYWLVKDQLTDLFVKNVPRHKNDIPSYLQGPVPKFDPAFMIHSLQGYSPHRAAMGQTMTKWDHKVRLWMENVMSTTYGVAPVLSLKLPE